MMIYERKIQINTSELGSNEITMQSNYVIQSQITIVICNLITFVFDVICNW